MSQADEDSWPLGFSCHVEFDFDMALSNIEDQLHQEFRKNEWVGTLREVLRDCYDKLMEIDANDSYLLVQITFLDMLWERLFGRVRGPSPWKSIRQGLLPGVLYGGGDRFDCHADMLSASGDGATDKDVLNFISGDFGMKWNINGSCLQLKSVEQMNLIFQRRAA
ncbi:hypothetical protein KJ359_012451 [Pestalotiopsis sp. 9143b]|nr:hypothetical protein KJ359_012451 [Pestalotiopsis sp. 9143b]